MLTVVEESEMTGSQENLRSLTVVGTSAGAGQVSPRDRRT
jgi:hypothetical protein